MTECRSTRVGQHVRVCTTYLGEEDVEGGVPVGEDEEAYPHHAHEDDEEGEQLDRGGSEGRARGYEEQKTLRRSSRRSTHTTCIAARANTIAGTLPRPQQWWIRYGDHPGSPLCPIAMSHSELPGRSRERESECATGQCRMPREESYSRTPTVVRKEGQ